MGTKYIVIRNRKTQPLHAFSERPAKRARCRMHDQNLRELEVQTRVSGLVEDEAAWLHKRVRAGDLPSEGLVVAAALGHEAALLASNQGAEGEERAAGSLEGLRGLGLTAVVRLAVALVRRFVESSHASFETVRALLALLRPIERWLYCPCLEHAISAGRLGQAGVGPWLPPLRRETHVEEDLLLPCCALSATLAAAEAVGLETRALAPRFAGLAVAADMQGHVLNRTNDLVAAWTDLGSNLAEAFEEVTLWALDYMDPVAERVEILLGHGALETAGRLQDPVQGSSRLDPVRATLVNRNAYRLAAHLGDRRAQTFCATNSLPEWSGPVTDDSLGLLMGLPFLQSVTLSFSEVTDNGLAFIARCRWLQDLRLFGLQLEGHGLKHLSRLASLRSLDLTKSISDEAALANLPSLSALESLNLSENPIGGGDGRGLAVLGQFASLSWLELGGTETGDSGLGELPKLPSLSCLGLQGTDVGDEGLACLAKQTSLRRLDLGDTLVSDEGLGNLRGLEALESLCLRGTDVGDEGLAHLAGLISLRDLDLSGTRVTDEGVEHLANLTSLVTLDLSEMLATEERVRALGQIRHVRVIEGAR